MNTAKLTSPTGLGIRNDPAGSGHYGSPRGKRRHGGIDFLCTPGQTVRCPLSMGKVIRTARPYAHDYAFNGLVIQGKHLAIKIFYLDPWPGIIGAVVKRGDPIGIAQDIRERYGGGMEAHVHLAIFSFNPELIFQGD